MRDGQRAKGEELLFVGRFPRTWAIGSHSEEALSSFQQCLLKCREIWWTVEEVCVGIWLEEMVQEVSMQQCKPCSGPRTTKAQLFCFLDDLPAEKSSSDGRYENMGTAVPFKCACNPNDLAIWSTFSSSRV